MIETLLSFNGYLLPFINFKPLTLSYRVLHDLTLLPDTTSLHACPMELFRVSCWIQFHSQELLRMLFL